MIYMTDTLARNWWAIALRGLCALLFGTALFLWPGISLFALVLLFGVYALLDGVCTMVSTVRSDKREKRWWLFLLQGIGGIMVGIMAFVWPGITALALLYIIAAWAIVTGIFEVVAAVELRKEIEGEWLLGVSGIASVVCGVLLVGFPGAGALAVLWIIGAYSILFGIFLTTLALRLRHRNGRRAHDLRATEA